MILKSMTLEDVRTILIVVEKSFLKMCSAKYSICQSGELLDFYNDVISLQLVEVSSVDELQHWNGHIH
jgi:hypothetical protein